MAEEATSLKWSSQLAVTPALRTPKLPGDKILLPQSALEQLLAAAPVVETPSSDYSRNSARAYTPGFDPFNPYTFAAEARARARAAALDSDALVSRQPQLPHPLTFRIVNPRNGRVINAGIREFSAAEGEVSLSGFLREALGVEEEDKGEAPTVTVQARSLPKGTYVRLRPLEAGYDPEDWKALLERHLRENFTTLTTGEVLEIRGGAGHGDFKFLVDKLRPEGDGICIVDTDLEVDIEPLSEEQALETLRRRQAKAARAPGTREGSSIGGAVMQGQETRGQVRRGEYVDYELREWDRDDGIQVELEAADGVDLDILLSPLSARQRARPRIDEYVFADLSTSSSKRIRLERTNIELADAEALYVSVHAFTPPDSGNDAGGPPVQYSLRIVKTSQAESSETQKESAPLAAEDEVECKNCHQLVPKRTLFLHENFCLRNNVFCPKCGGVFQKSSAEWQNHWHCEEHPEVHGNDTSSRAKHTYVSHTRHNCASCGHEAPTLPALAQHRTTLCPGKLILCQFCHLLVPQQGEGDPDPTDPEVLLSGLTPHELIDGGRTTECHLCGRITRLRDMKAHLAHHNLERLSRKPPAICANRNCGRTLSGGKTANDSSNPLGLCSICFGPLYANVYDPDGKALRRRVERRYLTQLLSGCGKPFCRNTQYCKTAAASAPSDSSSRPPSTTAGILPYIRPLVTNPQENGYWFCVDEISQTRRRLADMLAAEGVYELAWCVAAVEAAGGQLDRAREWLSSWAVRKDENKN